MIKLLHSPILLVFLLIAVIGTAQSSPTNTNFSISYDTDDIYTDHSIFSAKDLCLNKKDFSYNTVSKDDKHDFLHKNHRHTHELSILDVISSDEGTDFNCSGGFCMNELHYHKKGLTLKRQFFGYFMSISC